MIVIHKYCIKKVDRHAEKVDSQSYIVSGILKQNLIGSGDPSGNNEGNRNGTLSRRT